MFNNINTISKTNQDLVKKDVTNSINSVVLDDTAALKTKTDYTMKDIYRFTPEEQAGYTDYLGEKWSDACMRAQDEMMAWEMCEKYFSSEPPDYDGEINNQLNQLRQLTPYTAKYDFTCIVKDGEFDESKACALQCILHLYPELQKSATVTLEKIRWLVEHKNLNKEKPDSVEQIPFDEDEDTALLRKQIEALNFKPKDTECYPLLYALKDAWHACHKPWAADNSKFASKIAPILQKKSYTINKGLNRACENIRKEKSGIECFPLANLQIQQINIIGYKNKQIEFKKWGERRMKIMAIMSQNIAETSSEKNNCTKGTNVNA